jgi:phosphoenolpyruvate synthase/pyruvate phosphate dikinase
MKHPSDLDEKKSYPPINFKSNFSRVIHFFIILSFILQETLGQISSFDLSTKELEIHQHALSPASITHSTPDRPSLVELMNTTLQNHPDSLLIPYVRGELDLAEAMVQNELQALFSNAPEKSTEELTNVAILSEIARLSNQESIERALVDGKQAVYIYNPKTKKQHRAFISNEDIKELQLQDRIGQLNGKWMAKAITPRRQFLTGAYLLENGDWLLPKGTRMLTHEDTPKNSLILPLYSKVVPVAYSFLENYFKSEEDKKIIKPCLEKLETVDIILTQNTLGEIPYRVDKEKNTILIERDFLDSLNRVGMKRVGVALFMDAIFQLLGSAEEESSKALLDRVAQKSEPLNDQNANKGRRMQNRLQDAIDYYTLTKKIQTEKRVLTEDEVNQYLLFHMERTRSFSGRRAFESIFRDFSLYGTRYKTKREFSGILQELFEKYPQSIVRDIMTKEENEEDKFNYRMIGDYLADHSLTEDSDLVPFILTDARDEEMFGGKTVNTGAMQWLFGYNTLDGFSSAGSAFLTKLIQANAGMQDNFKKLNSELKEEVETLKEDIKKKLLKENKKLENITEEIIQKDPDFSFGLVTLTERYADLYQNQLLLEKDIPEASQGKTKPVQIDEKFKTLIRERLKYMAKQRNISPRVLMLAIRSSAIGEDGETASFAGRQDTSLYVMALKTLSVLGLSGLTQEYLDQLDQKRKAEKDPWKRLDLLIEALKQANIPFYVDPEHLNNKSSVEPWNNIMKAILEQLSRIDKNMPEIKDEELDPFINEWLANQRSLFNARSIDYRVRNNIPVYTDDVQMSTLFQQMGVFDLGYVFFGNNRVTGQHTLTAGIVEGSPNAIVSNAATTDSLELDFRGIPIKYGTAATGRKQWHAPNPWNEKIEEGGRSIIGPIKLDFPNSLNGIPAITDEILLGKWALHALLIREAYSMGQDAEGGFVIKREADGKPVYIKDPNQPDGIARDHAGNKRMDMTMVATQIRPETVVNLKNPAITVLQFKDISEEGFKLIPEEDILLKANIANFHSSGVAVSKVHVVDKKNKETHKGVPGNVMVTEEGTPDMDSLMHAAAAIVTEIGGAQSHTAIMATEFGWVVITGIPKEIMDNLYPGRTITVMGTRGMIASGDWSKYIVTVGENMDAEALPLLPGDFSLGLNVNSTGTAGRSWSLGGLYPSFKGSGLFRKEQALSEVEGAPEGLLRYDATRYKAACAKLSVGTLLEEEKSWLLQALNFHGEISKLKPCILDGSIVIIRNDQEERYGGTAFYEKFIPVQRNNNPDAYPPYDLNDQEQKETYEEMDALVRGKYLSGEERYVNVLAQMTEAIVSTFRVWPHEFKAYADDIRDSSLRDKVFALAEEYADAYNQPDPTVVNDYYSDLLKIQMSPLANKDPFYYIERLQTLSKLSSSKDTSLIKMLIKHMSKALFERLDDRKSDELEKTPGTEIKRDPDPMAGYRGIRMMLDNERMLRMQLRASKIVADKNNYITRIFAPVVYDPKHVARLKEIMLEMGFDLNRVQIGMMTETPQAFEIRPFLELGIGFTSTGGNDLAQFTNAHDRNLPGVDYFKSLGNRNLALYRQQATLANEIEHYNATHPDQTPVTCGYCGDWPSQDLVGVIFLFLLGYDSASLTLPRFQQAVHSMFNLLNPLYGVKAGLHLRGRKVLDLPMIDGKVDRKKIAEKLLTIIGKTKNPEQDNQRWAKAGFNEEIYKNFPALKIAIEQLNYNVYDQIDPNAKPIVRNSHKVTSLSSFHADLPFHYRLLEKYDIGELDVSESAEKLKKIELEITQNIDQKKNTFDSLVAEAKINPKEELLTQIDQLNKDLSELQKTKREIALKLRKITLKNKVDTFLQTKSFLKGKDYYIQSLKETLKTDAIDHFEDIRKNPLYLETDFNSAHVYREKEGSDLMELKKEGNPRLGNMGMKKTLNPDRAMFEWALEALSLADSEIKNQMNFTNGFRPFGIDLRMVREILEVEDTVILLKKYELHGKIDFAISLDVPGIPYLLDELLGNPRFKIDTIVMSESAQWTLAQIKRGTLTGDANTKRLGLDPLITEKDVVASLKDVSLPLAMTKVEKYGRTLVIPKNAPLQISMLTEKTEPTPTTAPPIALQQIPAKIKPPEVFVVLPPTLTAIRTSGSSEGIRTAA